jgi:tetratricopeptide (TPR) repeat protein
VEIPGGEGGGDGGGDLVIEITQELAREIEAKLRNTIAGAYRFDTWPALEIVVTPSFIRGQDGSAVEVRGIADADEAKRMLDAENARLAAERGDDDSGDDDDDDDDWDDDDDDEGEVPSQDRALAALGMTERALRLSPDDDEVQFAHANLLVDADRAGVAGKIEELLAFLPGFAPSVRLTIAVRLGDLEHARFADAVDLALGGPLPGKILGSDITPVGGAAIASFGDVASELFSELATNVLSHCPDRIPKLVPMLPGDVNMLAELAHQAISDHPDAALVIYDRLLSLPLPDERNERTNYLRAMNNACIQAHAAKAYEAAVRIADRAQPVAHENPYIYHSAACAYAAIGDYAKAFEQVKLAVKHDYDHINKVEIDSDLGPLLEWPEFKALFRDWHARQEGN